MAATTVSTPNFYLVSGVGIIFYYYFKDGLTSASDSKAFDTLENFPKYFGTTLFAINGVGVVGVIFSFDDFYQTEIGNE